MIQSLFYNSKPENFVTKMLITINSYAAKITTAPNYPFVSAYADHTHHKAVIIF
jgi:hypothetical protein